MDFGILGPLQVRMANGPVEIRSTRQRAILALLILNAGRVVSVDRLVELVWGDDPPKGGPRSLQFHMWKLRNALDPDRQSSQDGVIATRPPGYVLLADPDEIDATRFERTVTEAHDLLSTDPARAHGLIDEAMELWRGPPLDDIADEEFARLEIIRLDQLRQRAQEDRIEAALAIGDHQIIVGELATLTAQHPLRERLWSQYMVALARCGRQADALAAYQDLRRRLGDELGIEPSAEIQAIEERILLQDPEIMRPDRVPTPRRLRGYVLRKRLGAGAFGEVWQAVQPGVGRDVAVKVIRPDLSNRAQFVLGFEAEARVLAALEHPNIVPLFDFWRDPDGAYLVMPLMRGGSLASNVGESPREPEASLALIAAVADSLAYAHRHGVVHGDVSPQNILLDDEGRPYLADFGILSLMRGAGVSPTPSPAFRSPEQLGGEPPTPSSDVFALGVLAYFVLTGREPAPGQPLPSIASGISGVSDAADAVLAKATAASPNDRHDGPEAFLAALAESLGTAPRSLPRAAARNPYKGLRAFSEADTGDFFGRDELMAELVAAVAHHRLVGVVGPSGCGKSSLVRAGLIPELRRGAVPGSDRWLIVDLSPGRDPMAELEAALLGVATRSASEIPRMLRDAPSCAVGLAEAILPPGVELLLIVDQFEELFTLTADDGERRRFIDLLACLVEDPRARVRAVVTVRADFYDRPLEFAAFGEALGRGLVSVATPSELSLARAVTGPAAAVGVGLEPGLETEIVRDVCDQPGGLPLMEYALTELFARRSGAEISCESYRAMGGVTSALGRRAETLFNGCEESGKEAIRQVLLRLVQVADDGSDTRRRVPIQELSGIGIEAPLVDEVLTSFGAHRLLTFDRDPKTRSPTVEVAHEALMSGWDRLRGWIEDRREDLVLHRRLAALAGEWLESGRQVGYLLSGGRLAHYEQFATTTDLALSDDERAYLDESRQQADNLRARRRRRRRAVLSGFAAAAVVASTLAVFALAQRTESNRNAAVARARELAASAIAVADTDPELSLLLALESSRGGDPIVESVNALHRAILGQRAQLRMPPADWLFGSNWAALTPDGSAYVASDRVNQKMQVRNAATGELIWDVDAPRGGYEGVVLPGAFAPGGTEIVFHADRAEPANLFSLDTENGVLESIPFDWTCEVASIVKDGSGRIDTVHPIVVAYVPEGFAEAPLTLPATCTDTRLVVLRIDREKGETRQLAEYDAQGVSDPTSASWTTSRDGHLMALSIDARATVVDLTTGESRAYGPEGSSDDIIVLSPDGSLLASLGPNRNWVWSVTTDTLLWGVSERLQDAWFSVDGRYLIGSHNGGPTRIWVAATGEELTVLDGPYVTLLSDDGLVALSYRDWDSPRTTEPGVSIWNAGANGEVGAFNLPRESRYTLNDIEIAGGRFVVRYGALDIGGPVGVYDIATGEEVYRIPAGAGDDIALSPDGRYAAVQEQLGAGRLIGSVRIYDTLTDRSVLMQGLCTWDEGSGTGTGCGEFPDAPFPAFVTELHFSADGSQLIGGMWEVDRGYPMLVWDAATGEVIHRSPPLMLAGRITMSPDRSRVLVLDHGWDLTALETVGWTEVGTAQVDWVHEEKVFTPDGRHLVINSGDGLSIADAGSFETIREADGIGAERLLAVDPSGTLIASGHDSGIVKVYSFETLNVLQQIHIGEPIRNLAWLNDHHLLVIPISGPGIVVTTDVEELLEVADSRVTRTFTASECAAYGIDPCPFG